MRAMVVAGLMCVAGAAGAEVYELGEFGAWKVLEQPDPITDGTTYFVASWSDGNDACTSDGGAPAMAFMCSTNLPPKSFTFWNMCDPSWQDGPTATITVRFGSDAAFDTKVNGKFFAEEWGSYAAFTDPDTSKIGAHLGKMLTSNRFAIRYFNDQDRMTTLVFATDGLSEALSATPCEWPVSHQSDQ